jgi:hypothetical protein
MEGAPAASSIALHKRKTGVRAKTRRDHGGTFLERPPAAGVTPAVISRRPPGLHL